jgi:hypothetical protein
MKLDNWVRVRLTEGQMLIYTAEAERRGVPVSTYLRDRLAEADTVNEDVASIRAAMIDMGETMDELRDRPADRQATAPAQVAQTSNEPTAVQVETLLLLRALAGAQKLQMVMAEVERQGFTPWKATEKRDAPGR